MLSLVVKVAFVIEKIRAIRLSLADLSNRLGSASLNSSIAKIVFKISISSSWNAEIPLSYFVTTGIYNDSYTNEPHFYDSEHETVKSLEEIDLP